MKCHVPDMCLPCKESWATGFVSGSIKCHITLHLCCTNSLMEFLADFLYNEIPCFRYVFTMKGKLGYTLIISGSMKCHITLHFYCTNCLMEFLEDFLYNEMPCFRYVSTIKGELGYLIHFREYEMPFYTGLVLYQLSQGVCCRFPPQ